MMNQCSRRTTSFCLGMGYTDPSSAWRHRNWMQLVLPLSWVVFVGRYDQRIGWKHHIRMRYLEFWSDQIVAIGHPEWWFCLGIPLKMPFRFRNHSNLSRFWWKSHTSTGGSWKKGPWLIGVYGTWNPTQLCGDCNEPWEGSLLNNQYTYNGK